MKNFLVILPLVAVLIFCLTSQVIGIGKKNTPIQSQNKRDELISSLVKGKSFAVDNEFYTLLPELRSFKDYSQSPINGSGNQEMELSSLALSSSEVVERKGYFVFVKEDVQKEIINSTMSSGGTTELYPVVLNQRTMQFGVVTGLISIKIKEMTDLGIIVDVYNLTINKVFNRLNTGFFTADDRNQDLIQLVDDLNMDQRIESAKIEIVENLDEPL